MSFFSARFDPIDTTDEVKHIYRIRDNDPVNKEKKLNFINMGRVVNIDPDTTDNSSNMINYVFFKPSDPTYNSLTEEEKIENGLPSNYLLTKTTFMFHMVQFGLLAYGLSHIGNIYFPKGIILRRSNPESWSRFLRNRVPFVLAMMFMVYNMRIYDLRYFIDYYSNREDEIDRHLKENHIKLSHKV